ncbi:uncharacterized protein LOC144449958 [Glandiceps talaboti]
MPFIEGIGDEVTIAAVVMTLTISVLIAWWSTFVGDHPVHIRIIRRRNNRLTAQQVQQLRSQHVIQQQNDNVNNIENSNTSADSNHHVTHSSTPRDTTLQTARVTEDMTSQDTITQTTGVTNDNSVPLTTGVTSDNSVPLTTGVTSDNSVPLTTGVTSDNSVPLTTGVTCNDSPVVKTCSGSRVQTVMSPEMTIRNRKTGQTLDTDKPRDLISEINTGNDDITEINTGSDDITEINTGNDDITEINIGSDNITEIDTENDDIREVNTGNDDITDIDTEKDDITEINTPNDDITNIYTGNDNITDVSSSNDDITVLNSTSDHNTRDDFGNHSNRTDIQEETSDISNEQMNSSSGQFRIRLKFLNESERIVVASPQDTLGQFRRDKFTGDVSDGRTVRFIFNGHLLQDDNSTLQDYNITDNSVLHCHVSQTSHTQRENLDVLGNSDLDLGRFMVPLFGFILVTVWYLRWQYRYMFNATSTIALIAVTLLFVLAVLAAWRS